jgi:hypothetical protein
VLHCELNIRPSALLVYYVVLQSPSLSALTCFCVLYRLCCPCALGVQLLPLSWLFIRLARRYGVTFTDSSTLKTVGKLFAPTGRHRSTVQNGRIDTLRTP